MKRPDVFRFNKVVESRSLLMRSPISEYPADYALGEITDYPANTKGVFAYDSFKDCVRSACTQSRFMVLTACEPIGYAISLSAGIFDGACDVTGIRRFWARHQLQDLLDEDDLLITQGHKQLRVTLCQSLITKHIVGVWIPDQHQLQVLTKYHGIAATQARVMGLNGTVNAVSGFTWGVAHGLRAS